MKNLGNDTIISKSRFLKCEHFEKEQSSIPLHSKPMVVEKLIAKYEQYISMIETIMISSLNCNIERNSEK